MPTCTTAAAVAVYQNGGSFPSEKLKIKKKKIQNDDNFALPYPLRACLPGTHKKAVELWRKISQQKFSAFVYTIILYGDGEGIRYTRFKPLEQQQIKKNKKKITIKFGGGEN